MIINILPLLYQSLTVLLSIIINESINPSINQSVTQSVNQLSINQSINSRAKHVREIHTNLGGKINILGTSLRKERIFSNETNIQGRLWRSGWYGLGRTTF